MNVLIATPCFGRMIHQSYVSSLVGTVEGLLQMKADFQTLFLGNESNIQRARNDLMHYALTKKPNFTHLFFIDADMGWEWSAFHTILRSDRKILSGICVKKRYPIEVVVEPLLGEHPDYDRAIRVVHAPVAFMKIDLAVLREKAEKVMTYSGISSVTGKREKIWNFFPTGPDANGNFLSEDWGFTSLMRELDEPIFLQTGAYTTHSGIHTFKVGENGK